MSEVNVIVVDFHADSSNNNTTSTQDMQNGSSRKIVERSYPESVLGSTDPQLAITVPSYKELPQMRKREGGGGGGMTEEEGELPPPLLPPPPFFFFFSFFCLALKALLLVRFSLRT